MIPARLFFKKGVNLVINGGFLCFSYLKKNLFTLFVQYNNGMYRSQLLTIVGKLFILDVFRGPAYSDVIKIFIFQEFICTSNRMFKREIWDNLLSSLF